MIKIFGHYISGAFLWLIAGEVSVFYGSMQLANVIRFLSEKSWYSQGEMVAASLVFTVVMFGSFYANGLYRRTLDWDEYNLLERVFFAFCGAIFVLVLIYYVLPEHVIGRSILIYALIFSVLGILCSRYLFYRLVSFEGLARKVLVIGCGSRAGDLLRMNSRYVYKGFKVVGFVSLHEEACEVPDPIYINDENPLRATVERLSVDEIVIAIDDRRKTLPVDELLDIKMSGVEIMDLMTFYEREQRLILLKMLYPSWLVFSDGFANPGLRPFGKRSCDIVASVGLLSVTWPIMLLTAIAIYVEGGGKGPILYRQVRVGQKGRVFAVIKFRSMRTDAEKNGAQWAQKNDNRVTRVGEFIRKTRIDELPQLFNVLKGDMSFVGPRPERPEFVEGFIESIPYYRERHRVKPGITGWAQLCYPYGASEEDAVQKLQYDLYYVKNYSLFLDISIILSTFEVILRGKGAR
jgi:sugar transferase (PEP-CTERM system associated)